MGSPIAPEEKQYAELEAAGKLAPMEGPATVHVEGGQATLPIALPRQAVSLVVLEW
jgi:xylan 1,4-beta-xylosidase